MSEIVAPLQIRVGAERRKRWLRRVAAAIVLLLWIAGLGIAGISIAQGATLMVDDGKLWTFAERLRQQREYFRAVSEYRRLIHFFPDSPRVSQARVSIGLAFLQGGEPGRAISALDEDLLRLLPPPMAGDARFLRGVAWLDTEPQRPYALREPNIASALEELKSIPRPWPHRARTDGFVRAMEQPPELPDKSPGLAGGLSAVIPGSGSFYVGRYAEGSLALFVNALLIYATVDSFQNDQVALGTVFGVLALAFYGGSIYSAVNGAHKFNNAVRSQYLAQQRQRFGISVSRGQIGGAFNLSF